MISYGIEMAIQIEAGGITPVESMRLPLDSKMLGAIAIGSVDDNLLHVLGQRIEDYFVQLREDQTREFGECLAYGTNLEKEDVEKLTDHLVERTGSRGQVIAAADNHNGLDFIWAMKWTHRQIILRRTHVPIIFNNGDLVEDGTIFSLNSQPD